MEEFALIDRIVSELSVCAQNVRARHWLLMGPKYEGWHPFLGEIYEKLSDAADKAAEIIVQRGGVPVHTMSQFLERSAISEAETAGNWETDVARTGAELKQIIDFINLHDEQGAWDGAASNDLTQIASELYHYYMFCYMFCDRSMMPR